MSWAGEQYVFPMATYFGNDVLSRLYPEFTLLIVMSWHSHILFIFTHIVNKYLLPLLPVLPIMSKTHWVHIFAYDIFKMCFPKRRFFIAVHPKYKEVIWVEKLGPISLTIICLKFMLNSTLVSYDANTIPTRGSWLGVGVINKIWIKWKIYSIWGAKRSSTYWKWEAYWNETQQDLNKMVDMVKFWGAKRSSRCRKWWAKPRRIPTDSQRGSAIFTSVFQNSKGTGYLLDVTFIFATCYQSLAAVIPIKYGYDSKGLKDIVAKS